MIDYVIQPLTTPFVPAFDQSFNKIAFYMKNKHPEVFLPFVKEDLKAFVFNGSTASTVTLLTSAAALFYFAKIAAITAVAMVALALLFYLVRCIILAIPPMQMETVKAVDNLRQRILNTIPEAVRPPIAETEPEKTYQGYDLGIGSLVFIKLTHYSVPRVIRMIFTRSV